MMQRPVKAVVRVARSNEEMVEAIREARATLGDFMRAFERPRKNQTGFHLKVRFVQDGQVEHIWLGDLWLGSDAGSGVVANAARLTGFDFGLRVSFDQADVTDWMYTEDGELVGGYTTKVLRKLQQQYMADRLMSGLHRKFGPGSGQHMAIQ